MSNNAKVSINKNAITYMGKAARDKKKRNLAHSIVSKGAWDTAPNISTTNATNRYPQTNRYPTTGFGRYNNMIENAQERKYELAKVVASSNTSHTYNENKSKNINSKHEVYDYAALEKVKNDNVFKLMDLNHKNKLLELVESGIITYKNGQYHTNSKFYDSYVKKLDEKRRELDYINKKKLRDDEIDRRTDFVSSRFASFFAFGKVNKRFLRKLVARKYDRDEKKNLKKEYKKKSKINRMEKKYGKLY